MIIDVSAIPAGEALTISTDGMIEIPESFGFVHSADVVVSFEGQATRNGIRFVLQGTMSAFISTFCSVCLEPVTHKLTCDIYEVFSRKPEDIDEWLVSDNSIDLFPALRAVLLTSLPGRIVCKNECAPDDKYRLHREFT